MKTKVDENTTPETIIAEAMVGAGAPLMHSRVEEAVAGALRKAGMLVERSEQVCAWCPSSARGSAWHNDGKLHPSCGQVNHGQGWVPDYPVERIGAIEAERDAALAAVERVQETLSLHNPNGRLVKEVLAALDGAPEPEDVWEYGYELIEPDDRNVFEREGDFISAAFAYRAAKKRIHEERHPDVPSLKYAIIRRRKAGPWLPVEGEKQ